MRLNNKWYEKIDRNKVVRKKKMLDIGPLFYFKLRFYEFYYFMIEIRQQINYQM